MNEKFMELMVLLEEGLKRYGFIRKKKHAYQRKIKGGVQEIAISPTKTRGKDEVHIYVLAGFSYPELNKVICFLRDEEYEKKWFTSFINIAFLINPTKPYGFYIDQFTDVASIADNILTNIEKYVLPFLEKCNTLEKYESMLLSRDEAVRSSTVERSVWNILALSLLLNRQNSDELIEEYYSEFAREIKKLEIAKEQIKKYNPV